MVLLRGAGFSQQRFRVSYLGSHRDDLNRQVIGNLLQRLYGRLSISTLRFQSNRTSGEIVRNVLYQRDTSLLVFALSLQGGYLGGVTVNSTLNVGNRSGQVSNCRPNRVVVANQFPVRRIRRVVASRVLRGPRQLTVVRDKVDLRGVGGVRKSVFKAG